MSVQDHIAFPTDETNAAGSNAGFWRHLLVVSVFCFAVLLAWSSQILNISQIVAMALMLSLGLNIRVVMKLDAVDAEGLDDGPISAEKFIGTAVVSTLAALSLILASTVVGPLGGIGQFLLFLVASTATFAVALAAEGTVSVVACFALKPLFSKSAIGAEIAVMLNLQQKYRTQLV